jgi:hypothetical protein
MTRNLDLLPAAIRRETDPGKRYVTMMGSWSELRSDALARDRGEVMAANSFASALTTQFLLDGAVTKLQNRWAALKCFSRDFGTDPIKPLAVAQTKFVSATDGVVQTNATNFESGNSTVSAVAITPQHYSRSFQVTDSDLNNGLRMADLLEINIAVFADQIIQSATAPITAANFSTLPPYVQSAGNWGWPDMTNLWGLLQKSPIHNIILRGDYLAKILNVPAYFQKTGDTGSNAGSAWAPFGWDNVALNTNWTGADANVTGFACNPQAIGCLAGTPLTVKIASGMGGIDWEDFKINGVDLVVRHYTWFSLATRTLWHSFDSVFGASLLDATAGNIIRSS